MRESARLNLVVDCLLVVFSFWYVMTAQSYPGAARLVPTVVGGVCLVVAVVQLLGNFIGRLAGLTRELPAVAPAGVPADAAAGAPPGGLPAPSAAVEQAVEEVPELPAPVQDRRQVIAILWSVGLIAGLYLFGYEVTVPLFMLLYFTFAYRVQWTFALGSAVFMGLITTLVFSDAIGLTLPQGLVFRLLGGG